MLAVGRRRPIRHVLRHGLGFAIFDREGHHGGLDARFASVIRGAVALIQQILLADLEVGQIVRFYRHADRALLDALEVDLHRGFGTRAAPAFFSLLGGGLAAVGAGVLVRVSLGVSGLIVAYAGPSLDVL